MYFRFFFIQVPNLLNSNNTWLNIQKVTIFFGMKWQFRCTFAFFFPTCQTNSIDLCCSWVENGDVFYIFENPPPHWRETCVHNAVSQLSLKKSNKFHKFFRTPPNKGRCVGIIEKGRTGQLAGSMSGLITPILFSTLLHTYTFFLPILLLFLQSSHYTLYLTVFYLIPNLGEGDI